MATVGSSLSSSLYTVPSGISLFKSKNQKVILVEQETDMVTDVLQVLVELQHDILSEAQTKP